MSDTTTLCPKCKSPYAYSNGGSLLVCPECNNEWNPADEVVEEILPTVIKDAYGTVLQDGDTVVILKDLPVKGAPKAIKTGMKVKNIKLTYGGDGHNIDCKIDGFGGIALKSEFVKKA